MGWTGGIHCDKFGHDFVARTFALIAPFELILHRVSCSNEMVPNAHKHYEMHQNMEWIGAFVAKNSNATLWLELWY